MIVKLIELILTIMRFFTKSQQKKSNEAMAELEGVLRSVPISEEDKLKKLDEEAKWLGKRL